MIVALSRFCVKNGKEAEVRRAFVERPRRVEGSPGFLGLEVFTESTDSAKFLLLTRWADEASFRAWHGGPEHHASHAAMPSGLKLDPAATSLTIAARIDGASSGGAVGEALTGAALACAELAEHGTALHLATLDSEGRVEWGNAAFAGTLGRRGAVGEPLRDAITAESALRLDGALGEARTAAVARVALDIADGEGGPVRLSCALQWVGAGFVLAGEPAWRDNVDLAERLAVLNGELAVLAREHARQARELAAAKRALEESHWFVRKIADVLPICLGCGKVRAGASGWQDVATFLAQNSQFLSHGYCSSCADALEAEDV